LRAAELVLACTGGDARTYTSRQKKERQPGGCSACTGGDDCIYPSRQKKERQPKLPLEMELIRLELEADRELDLALAKVGAVVDAATGRRAENPV
jgi:hypothetical protein